jgi:hypothetical protein
LRLHLTADGEKRLLAALKLYCGILDRVMAQSTAAQCDAMGEQMRRIEAILGPDE